MISKFIIGILIELKCNFYFLFFTCSRVSVLEAFDPLLMGNDGDDDDKGKYYK